MRPYHETTPTLTLEQLAMAEIQRSLRGQTYVSIGTLGFVAWIIAGWLGFWLGLLGAALLLAYPVYTLWKIKERTPYLERVPMYLGKAHLNEFRHKRSVYRIDLHYRFLEKDYVVKKEINEADHRGVSVGAYGLEGIIDRRKPEKLLLWNLREVASLPARATTPSDSVRRDLSPPAAAVPAKRSGVGALGVLVGTVGVIFVVWAIWMSVTGLPQRPETATRWTEWEAFGANNLSKKVEVNSANRDAGFLFGRTPLLSQLKWRVGSERDNFYHLEFQNLDTAAVTFDVWSQGASWGPLTIQSGQINRVSKYLPAPARGFSVELKNLQYLDTGSGNSK